MFLIWSVLLLFNSPLILLKHLSKPQFVGEKIKELVRNPYLGWVPRIFHIQMNSGKIRISHIKVEFWEFSNFSHLGWILRIFTFFIFRLNSGIFVFFSFLGWRPIFMKYGLQPPVLKNISDYQKRRQGWVFSRLFRCCASSSRRSKIGSPSCKCSSSDNSSSSTVEAIRTFCKTGRNDLEFSLSGGPWIPGAINMISTFTAFQILQAIHYTTSVLNVFIDIVPILPNFLLI